MRIVGKEKDKRQKAKKKGKGEKKGGNEDKAMKYKARQGKTRYSNITTPCQEKEKRSKQWTMVSKSRDPRKRVMRDRDVNRKENRGEYSRWKRSQGDES